MSKSTQCIVIAPEDNVATAIVALPAGEAVEIGGRQVLPLADIPYGHKFALADVARGDYLIKYGARIGRATVPILTGDHVHVHNVEDIVDEVRKA